MVPPYHSRAKFRTRPSTARPGIVLESSNISIDFCDRRSTIYDPSFRPPSVIDRDKHVKSSKKKKSGKKRQPKKPTISDFDEKEVKKMNALFEEADDFSFIIEPVTADNYVLPGATTHEDSVWSVQSTNDYGIELDSFYNGLSYENRSMRAIEHSSASSMQRKYSSVFGNRAITPTNNVSGRAYVEPSESSTQIDGSSVCSNRTITPANEVSIQQSVELSESSTQLNQSLLCDSTADASANKICVERPTKLSKLFSQLEKKSVCETANNISLQRYAELSEASTQMNESPMYGDRTIMSTNDVFTERFAPLFEFSTELNDSLVSSGNSVTSAVQCSNKLSECATQVDTSSINADNDFVTAADLSTQSFKELSLSAANEDDYSSSDSDAAMLIDNASTSQSKDVSLSSVSSKEVRFDGGDVVMSDENFLTETSKKIHSSSLKKKVDDVNFRMSSLNPLSASTRRNVPSNISAFSHRKDVSTLLGGTILFVDKASAVSSSMSVSSSNKENISSLGSDTITPDDDSESSEEFEECALQRDTLQRFYYLRGFDGDPTSINYALHVCEQSVVLTWSQIAPNGFVDCKKIGEGAYGEVFRTYIDGEPVALKVIPFIDEVVTYDGLVNGERLKHTLEILPELLITKELSALSKEQPNLRCGFVTPSFVQVVRISIVKGDYPDQLLREWDKFAKKTENERPDLYSSPEQLFIVFALAMGGKDLESYTIKNEREALSIFFQIALSLMVAEESLEFEHRDLHWGNVLIKHCGANEPITYIVNGQTIVIKACNVRVSIIDFTNSRMRREETTIFLDLSTDEELFKGYGDYQFDIYRAMRAHNGDDWKKFCPHTNALWLHYIATKVFSATKIPMKRRRELLELTSGLVKSDRIATFLKEKAISEVFTNYLMSAQ